MKDFFDKEREARAILHDLKDQKKTDLDQSQILERLGRCVCLKFGMEDIPDTDLKNLAIYSVKLKMAEAGKITNTELQSQIRSHDCHQTSLVVQMKNLFIMFVENELGIRLEDAQAVKISTLEQLADAVMKKMSEESYAEAAGGKR